MQRRGLPQNTLNALKIQIQTSSALWAPSPKGEGPLVHKTMFKIVTEGILYL